MAGAEIVEIHTGGYANAIGVHLAALDEGLAEIKARARTFPAQVWHRKAAPDLGTPAEMLLHIAAVEAQWIHRGIGGLSPAAEVPAATASLEQILAQQKMEQGWALVSNGVAAAASSLVLTASCSASL